MTYIATLRRRDLLSKRVQTWHKRITDLNYYCPNMNKDNHIKFFIVVFA